MIARSIANRLLEDEQELNAAAELQRLTGAAYPGIELEIEGNHWNVYKKAQGQQFIGEITYDDMATMPRETMTPEQIKYWDTHRWMASAGFRDSERTFCASFEEAMKFILAVHAAKSARVVESLDPDDPDLYIHADSYTKQPQQEVWESSLRVRLGKLYDEISISHRPSPFAAIFTPFVYYWVWTLHCKRHRPLPLQRVENRYGGPLIWRTIIRKWFKNWAEENGLAFMNSTFKTYGRLRSDVTFQFETFLLKRRVSESDQELTPEEFFREYTSKLGWEDDLFADLWKFHRYGIRYRVRAAEHVGLVVAEICFPPYSAGNGDFPERLKEFVVAWLEKRRIVPVHSSKVTVLAQPNPLPKWLVIVSVNTG